MKMPIRFLETFAATPVARVLVLGTLAVAIAAGGLGCPRVENCFLQTNLVSNGPISADNTDENLVNGWGLAFSPTSFAWVANNGTGTSTVYDGAGNVQPLVVSVPRATTLGSSVPTGIVANTTDSFEVTLGLNSAPALFLFATEDGGISGWNPTVDATNAILAVYRAEDEPIYTGLALASTDSGDFLFAADFANDEVDVFDGTFDPVTSSGGFVDTLIPSSYSPYGIAYLGGLVYVSYAQRDESGEDVVDGEGLGYIDTFTTEGVLVRRLVQNMGLNAPWGMAIAPADFGRFSGKLLVGNFGNGTISAYTLGTGGFRGQMRNDSMGLLTIDGLWGLAFGNGAHDQPTNTLYFTAGPNGETDGLFGSLVVCP